MRTQGMLCNLILFRNDISMFESFIAQLSPCRAVVQDFERKVTEKERIERILHQNQVALQQANIAYEASCAGKRRPGGRRTRCTPVDHPCTSLSKSDSNIWFNRMRQFLQC